MTPEKLTELFCSWWKDSFSTITPNSRTVDTHVAFAAYVLSKNEPCVEQSNKHEHKN